MTITENKNFISVSEYKTKLSIKDIENAYETEHLSFERLERLELARKLNSEYDKDKKCVQAEIDRIFLVDKGHKAGMELHCVTKKGIIFILNERKYRNGNNSFITALIGRPNQVKRLYEACNLTVAEKILNKCKYYQSQKLNEK